MSAVRSSYRGATTTPRVSSNPMFAGTRQSKCWDRGYHESMNGVPFGAQPYRRATYSLAWEAGWKVAQEKKRAVAK